MGSVLVQYFFLSRFRAVFKFEGNNLNVTATGKDFKDFKSAFTNDDRGFGYIRISVSILQFNRKSIYFH